MEKEKEKDISPISIHEMLGDILIWENPVSEGEAKRIAEILNNLGGLRVGGALEILDKAKSVLLECTVTHDEYRP